jgi:hypothetical protein
MTRGEHRGTGLSVQSFVGVSRPRPTTCDRERQLYEHGASYDKPKQVAPINSTQILPRLCSYDGPKSINVCLFPIDDGARNWFLSTFTLSAPLSIHRLCLLFVCLIAACCAPAHTTSILISATRHLHSPLLNTKQKTQFPRTIQHSTTCVTHSSSLLLL